MIRFVSAIAVLAMAAPSYAQLIAPPSAPFTWSVGQGNSTMAHFDNMNLGGAPYPGPFAPDVGSFHPGLASATLLETTGQGFLTGSGNIYSPSSIMAFVAQVPHYGLGSGYGTTVVVQTRTLGSEVAYNGLSLNWSEGSTPNSLTATAAFFNQELERTALGGFGGFSVTHAWAFAVPNSPGQFTLSFAAEASSMSLDQLRIDTFTFVAVPESSSLGFAVMDVVAIVGRLRRRGGGR